MTSSATRTRDEHVAANEPADVSDVDISNQHLVGWRGDGLTIVIPPIPSVPIPADEALVFAAWIVCLAQSHQPGRCLDALRAGAADADGVNATVSPATTARIVAKATAEIKP